MTKGEEHPIEWISLAQAAYCLANNAPIMPEDDFRALSRPVPEFGGDGFKGADELVIALREERIRSEGILRCGEKFNSEYPKKNKVITSIMFDYSVIPSRLWRKNNSICDNNAIYIMSWDDINYINNEESNSISKFNTYYKNNDGIGENEIDYLFDEIRLNVVEFTSVFPDIKIWSQEYVNLAEASERLTDRTLSLPEAPNATPSAGRRAGRPERYKWDEFWVEVIARIHVGGLPKTQAELVAKMQQWFLDKFDEAPAVSEIKKRLKMVYDHPDMEIG